jgi:hypothetical protein
MNKVSRIAIFDLGSARTKLLIASYRYDGSMEVKRYKEETSLAGELDNENLISKDTENDFVAAVSRLATIAANANVDALISVATDAFRRAKNSKALIQRLKNVVGDVSTLSPINEGLIFHASVKQTYSLSEEFCLLDIGGGSVQIVWGDSANQVNSIPTGTFKLESQFQSGNPPTDNVYKAMQVYIRKEASSVIPNKLIINTLIFGSNCMEEFFLNALHTAKLITPDTKVGKAFPLYFVQDLFDKIKGRDYEKLNVFFPENPKFMFGADKALLNILVVSDLLSVKNVMPTNESVSTGLARLALMSPEMLYNFGVSMNIVSKSNIIRAL